MDRRSVPRRGETVGTESTAPLCRSPTMAHTRTMNPTRLRRAPAALVLAAVLAVATPGARAACPTPPADVNGDDATDVVDVQCVILTTLWTLGPTGDPPGCLAGEPSLADLECGGSVDVADVVVAIRLVLGLPLSPAMDANGDLCADACQGCVAAPATCDDGDPCTADACDPGTEQCTHGAVSCSDGDPCNGVETCSPGVGCVPGAAPTCSDGDPCNGVETCVPGVGCTAGAPLSCSDGDPCNGVETCVPGVGCTAGAPLSCSDGDPCNGVETCVTGKGCIAGTAPCTNQQACVGSACVDLYPDRRVGIFYLAWHAYASDAIRKLAPSQRLTLEDVIQSPATMPSAMIQSHGLYGEAAAFHYSVEPQLGFYCLYRPRPGEAPYPEPDAIAPCPNISEVAATHAELLWSAGVDFVFVDLTNIPFYSTFADVLGVRPIEVLAEEWRALRDSGVMTPQIAAWVPMPPKSGASTWTWEKLRTALYDDPAYDDLVLRDKKTGRKVLFAVENGGFPLDAGALAAAESNGGKNDVLVVPMWGNLSAAELAAGRASWMQPCEAPGPPNGDLQFTTLVAHQNPCSNRYTTASKLGTVLSVSASFQVGYASLPMQAAGRNEGLTLKKQFQTAFAVKPDYLLINSWNELIAQPQSNAGVTSQGPMGHSMGITPSADGSYDWLWVDTYGAEFARDLEPTVEYGDGPYQLMRSCITAYKAGGCGAAPGEACCQIQQTYTLVHSMRIKDPDQSMDTDHVPTTAFDEVLALLGTGSWEQVCNPFYGPPSTCATSSNLSGDAPFQLLTQPGPGRVGLYRCYSGVDHFISTSSTCEGTTGEGLLGYLSTTRTSHTPRPLCRCYNTPAQAHFHWIGESCPTSLPGVSHESLLGFVK